MSQEFISQNLSASEARPGKQESHLRHILTIALSAAICAIIGVAYVYI